MLATSSGVSRALSACRDCYHGATTLWLVASIVLGMSSRGDMLQANTV